MAAESLITRCEYLIRVYTERAVLVIELAVARASNLFDLAGPQVRHDVKMGIGFRLTLVEVRAALALQRLKMA